LLGIQAFTLFVAIPLGGKFGGDRTLLDICHLAFVAVCVVMLTRRRALQAALLGSMAILVVAPRVAAALNSDLQLRTSMRHQTILVFAFVFNVLITALVARNVFAVGRVTAHRISGAILLYLNVAALFAVAYRALAWLDPNAFHWTYSRAPNTIADVTAGYSYFSLVTITTTGYGDVVPVHWLARSLSNLEAALGQLFPATWLARLVALEITQEFDGGRKANRPRSVD
jgi:hypothetical protein